ncbi:CDP-alcohol phosphatidyltransferase family protein [Nocardiopsis sp. RSe5-2]|uniref:CDP-alcohol phosphatidyltransferase family protein n=1 Tax=Nocardiopsis endophytica TaxID=3018445 RepID=A0ABT4U1D2_9ACTN|nr:CDP-alcohol phosphatidyltransferase family protein [Nocardiopsis endophytica]MDA2810162.1 CDP-alcohol phosphatidyltransferase family protein [Nocardiopsis endophytica]
MGVCEVPAYARPAAPPAGPWCGTALGALALPVLMSLMASTVGLGAAGWAAGSAYALVLWVLLARGLRRDGAPALRPADRVTLARAVLVGAVAALVADAAFGRPGHTWVLVVTASVALAMDGLDGPVARRTGTASRLGARFDMEVDAFLILALSVHAAFLLGPWTLAIGGARYAFAGAARVAPWLNGDLPPSTARKAVAVVQAVALIAAVSGVLPHGLAVAVAAGALALLAWSFGRDMLWLWRARERTQVDGADGHRTPHAVRHTTRRPDGAHPAHSPRPNGG